ncbi:1,4-alpha-glucan branching protein [Streptomyces sp. L2]|uniref:maltokinase N-terminal cap-like domain-containing protein n=1 Tax=Streptomyces sp. L2 TaxID=2162665 RepID=UPI0010107FFF|nr:1,4-alpha-glucan branching protein [Streptomyces sp. L2]
MAVIHRTTVSPTKLELLTAWLPTRPWYRGGPTPVLAKSGGFRLDDPEGEVGTEFMVVTDTSGPEPTAYLVPLTYRGAPLEGAGHALVGTMEHGVLGTRWVYDGCHDPVLVTESLALIEGRARAQAQSLTDTPDHDVTRACTCGPLPAAVAPAAADDDTGTRVPLPQALTLHVHRVLDPSAPTPPEGALGHAAGVWQGQDGERAQAVFMVLRGA